MKKFFLITLTTFITFNVWSQTNTFPTTGNVGIGTISPLTKLQVGQNSSTKTSDELMRLSMDVTEPGIKTALHIDANLSSPSWDKGIAIELGLKSNLYNEYTSRIIHYGNSATTRASKLQLQTHSVTDGIWNVGILIDDIGNVGIGTTSPTEKLEVKDGNFRLSNLTGVAYGSLGKIDFYNYASAASVVSARIEGKRDSYSHKDGRLSFYTSDNDGNLNEQLTIDRNGKVGIGTTSPSAGFDVFMSTNDYWTAKIKNNGGSSKGLLLEVGYGGGPVATIMQLNDGSGNVRAVFKSNGNVGIGTTNPTYKLAVTGTIGCGELIVEDVTGWADFVFEDNYNLMSLKDLDRYIKINKHLPEIPTTAEVEENGISVGEMNAKLLQKIEELTLYTIQQQEVIEALKTEMEVQNKRIEQLENK